MDSNKTYITNFKEYLESKEKLLKQSYYLSFNDETKLQLSELFQTHETNFIKLLKYNNSKLSDSNIRDLAIIKIMLNKLTH